MKVGREYGRESPQGIQTDAHSGPKPFAIKFSHHQHECRHEVIRACELNTASYQQPSCILESHQLPRDWTSHTDVRMVGGPT